MIRPADAGMINSTRSADPFFTRILSLYQAYGEGYDFVGFWYQESGGGEGRPTALISRFEDKFSLYLTPDSDVEEIAAFLRFQGAGSVMLDSSYTLLLPDAQGAISGDVLEYTGADYNSDTEIYEPDLKELYALLKTCESEIFRVPDYMQFLSDLTHRRNMGKLTLAAAGAGGVTASSAMTVSETPFAAILGAVATRPEYRGRGLSRALVRTLSSKLRGQGRRVYVFSASEANTRFYINSGFQITAGFKEYFL